MSEIVDFLLARLAEDELVAREAVGADDPHWRVIECAEDIGQVLTADGREEVAYARRRGRHSAGVGWQTARHIVRHDPARVLAEVEAKRRIMERHEMVSTYFGVFNATMVSCRICSTLEEDAPCVDLRLLALPYADHPDYRQEWRP